MKRSQAGATLIECLVYVSVLTVLGNIIVSTYVDVSRLSVYGTAAIDRMHALDQFREAFNRTVHESSGRVESVGPYKSDDGHLVLALAPGEDGTKRFAVLGSDPTKPGLQILTLRAEDGAAVPERCMLFDLPVTGVKAAYVPGDKSGAARVVVEASILGAKGDRKKPPTVYGFESALRMEGGTS